MAATMCVHCGDRSNVTFFPRKNRWDDPFLTWVKDQSLRSVVSQQPGTIQRVFDAFSEVLTATGADGIKEKWCVGRCESCLKPLFLLVDESEEEIRRVFPPISLDLPGDLPPAVAADFIEGSLCLSVGAPKAAVSMFRRALQAAAVEKESKKKKLVDQLDELGEKGLLNASLLDVAHQVRHFGNFGVHPDKDGLGDVTEQEALAVKDLTWQVMEDLYVNPVKTKDMKAALARKKKTRRVSTASQDNAEAVIPNAEGEG